MMSDAGIPEDVRNFIVSRIDSIAHMEALLLLRRDPAVGWNGARLASRLYISVPEAGDALERLHRHGLLTRTGEAYAYGCACAETDSLVGRAAHLYATHLIPVTHLIHSRPSNPIQKFADAFTLKKGK
jgi:hypothetical protein